MRLAMLILMVGCAKPAPAPAAGAELDPDARFSFAWPDGAEAVRTAVRTTERSVGGQQALRSLSTSERWKVARSETGWTIDTVDGRFELVDGEPAPAVMVAMAAVPMRVAITDEGRFGGIVDPEDWVERAREAMREAVPEGDAMAAIQADLAAQSGPLSEALARDWFAAVELWLGNRAAPGSTGQLPGTDPLGAMTTEVTTWSVDGPVACGKGGPVTCVRATATVVRPQERLQAEAAPVLATWERALPEAPKSSGIRDLGGDLVVVVVVEPATLLPWRYERSRSLRGVAQVDEESMDFQTTDSKVVSWTWTLPGGGP